MSTLLSWARDGLQALPHAARNFRDDAMRVYSAALAYRVLLALFPFLVFLVALLAFLDVPQVFEWLQQQASMLVPAAAMEPIIGVIDEMRQPRGGLLSFGILFAIGSASFAVLMLMDALNVAYGVKERRPTWKRLLLAPACTIGVAAMLIVAAGLMIVGTSVAGWVAQQYGLEQEVVSMWGALRWPVAVLLQMLAISLVYRVVPARQYSAGSGALTPGAVLAVVVWIAASLGFGYYVRNVADYGATYGSLGALIVLLLYCHISAAVLLFGAEVNAVLQGRRARAGAGSRAGISAGEAPERRRCAPLASNHRDAPRQARRFRGGTP